MKININNGLVAVEYSEQSPEHIKLLLDQLQKKLQVKSKAELSKIFGLSAKYGARHLRAWCAPYSAAIHQPMPKLSYELLLQLTGNGEIEVNNA